MQLRKFIEVLVTQKHKQLPLWFTTFHSVACKCMPCGSMTKQGGWLATPSTPAPLPDQSLLIAQNAKNFLLAGLQFAKA